MKQAVAYVRVSTGRQGKSGLGLEAQRAAIQAFAAGEGIEVAAWFTEVETGKRGAAANAREADAFASNLSPVVRLIQAAGVTSLRGIADALNARGVATPRGGQWHPQSVGRLLDRAA
jgi:hypothetical protein